MGFHSLNIVDSWHEYQNDTRSLYAVLFIVWRKAAGGDIWSDRVDIRYVGVRPSRVHTDVI